MWAQVEGLAECLSKGKQIGKRGISSICEQERQKALNPEDSGFSVVLKVRPKSGCEA